MDDREKLNIKLMVNCETQEPFYPVTHALAINVIDEGLLKNLLDILSIILLFIREFGGIDFSDLLTLGEVEGTAYYGEKGAWMWNLLHALSEDIASDYENSLKDLDDPEYSNIISNPPTALAVYNFVNNLIDGIKADGEVVAGDHKAVSGDTVYEFIYNNVFGGIIEENNTKLVSGGTVWAALLNLEVNGDIAEGETRAVPGNTIYNAIRNLQGGLLWTTDSNHAGSIKLKSTENIVSVSKSDEVAIGKYNSSNDNTVFSVGIGNVQSNCNALEVTTDRNNSLKIPYNNKPVSIQSHMRNEQADILHLTLDLFDKLLELINDKWKAIWTFTGTALGTTFYNGNTGILLKWSIKDSEDLYYTSNQIDTSYTKILLNLNGTFEDVITGINTSNTTYNITNYTLSPFLFNFLNNGKCDTTFKMFVKTKDNLIEDITTGKSATISLYAPSYIFCSTNPNITSIDNLPSGYKTVNCTSKSQFSANITIPSNTLSYIYIVTPLFINITQPTALNQPFKDADSGFEFSLSNEYYENATKSFTVCNKSTTVDYNLVRSDQLLTQGTTWNIKSK